jgi:hypothetical protein
MTRWEVRCLDSGGLGALGPKASSVWTKKQGEETTLDQVNDLARQGWELVSVTPITVVGTTDHLLFTFKRPIE